MRVPPIRRLLPAALALALGGIASVSATAAEVTVFAAASLTEVLREVAALHEARSGDTVRLNLGGSSTLARQIKEGAPADVFFSADEAKMDDLAAAGLVAEDTRVTLLTNTLVIVVPADAPTGGAAAIHSPDDLATDRVRRLALAEPRTVPAGIYARAYLENLQLWDRVSPKVVGLENVRAALAAVEAGNADAGIVYRTDALISRRVRVAFEVPAADGPRIAYPVAVLREARQPEAARAFVVFLASDEAQAVFRKHGFPPQAD